MKTSSPNCDKEERRIIAIESLKDLANFHNIEREEKGDTLKIYTIATSIAIGSCAGLLNIKVSNIFWCGFILILFIVIITNIVMLKKLCAIRRASNNIYNEYGQRLIYLFIEHMSDLDNNKKNIFGNYFKTYIGEMKKGHELLPEHSSDKYEVHGFGIINTLLCLLFAIPILKLIKWIRSNGILYIKDITLTDNLLYLISLAVAIFIAIIVIHVQISIINSEKQKYKNDRIEEENKVRSEIQRMS